MLYGYGTFHSQHFAGDGNSHARIETERGMDYAERLVAILSIASFGITERVSERGEKAARIGVVLYGEGEIDYLLAEEKCTTSIATKTTPSCLGGIWRRWRLTAGGFRKVSPSLPETKSDLCSVIRRVCTMPDLSVRPLQRPLEKKEVRPLSKWSWFSSGQEDDRHIRLIYSGVVRYEIRGKRERLGWHDSFHGDIYTHEVRVGDTGGVVHEILFRSDSTIEVECVDFRVDDEIRKQPIV
jgi:hypothetical protein